MYWRHATEPPWNMNDLQKRHLIPLLKKLLQSLLAGLLQFQARQLRQ